ncbi:hypothetical protein P9Z39_08890, partial [Bacillus thuringiensis]
GVTGPTGTTGETGPGITPIYGSLITNPNENKFAVINTNVDFDFMGPFNGVTPSVIGDSITINSSGVYTITFSTIIDRVDPSAGLDGIIFMLTINGMAQPGVQLSYNGFNQTETLSRADQLTLNQGDVLRILIFATTGNLFYFSASFVVTKVN